MGNRKNKQLAEFQFDSSAAPVSLGVKFESFSQYTIDLNLDLEDNYDLEEDIYLLSDETENIDEQSKTIILLAEKIEATLLTEFSSLDEFEEYQPSTVTAQSNEEVIADANISEIVELKNQQSEEIQIAESSKPINFVDDDISLAKGINPSMTSIRLIMLAIERLEKHERSVLELEDQSKYPFREILIDKSDSSIKLINSMGHKIEDYFLKKYPTRYKYYPQDLDPDRKFLDNNIIVNQVDKILHSAILAKHITKESVQFNTKPGFKLGCQGSSNQLTTYQILNNLKFRTMKVDSPHFRNFERLVNNIDRLYDVDLINLKSLVSRAKRFDPFVDHRSVTFSEEDQFSFDQVIVKSQKVLKDWWNILKFEVSVVAEFTRREFFD